ncbi:hypothetical protein K450DRAFT_257908 [Umbelopsis ramanniana AG]|uniref:Coatomer subunit delta n=1 Tax=Umbelopsis ramanniana AG TaxID=1314678 RepID=A0AAD5E3Z5_UMBRA|nr:uncharacterized protein K450DRAFT_257908 [Umbelopsis ramanniana AG]KAI8576259.1 hypothetical protein K450DRAFT_257908 [Umbelopsis ramanniana AG]
MVVLAAAVVTKGGKAVISRQFREMQRSRIEGLLASFPKLTIAGQQHTTVETEHVRYVYQPLDELFMVLITNRQSNILQDIESLHLFARVVADTCRSCDEREILRNAFELLSAFDEIISEGYRENVNLSQVKSIIEMESHEEKIQEIIARNKEQEAKEELKRKAKQLEMQRREAAKRGQMYMQGNYSGGFSGNRASPSLEPTVQAATEQRSTYNSSPAPAASRAKGMKLGHKGKSADIFEAIKSEVEEPLLRSPAVTLAPISTHPQESVHVTAEERMRLVANRDGGLEQLEVKGVLVLKISNPDDGKVRILVNAEEDSSIQFKTHPKVDKTLFKNENVVQMGDPSRSFPINQPLEVVRWRYITQDETSIPLSINCWPSPAGDGTCDVNVEYELMADHLELKDVIVSIPLPSSSQPNVNQVDGEYSYDPQRRTLDWQIAVINSSNKEGVLEFNVAGDDVDAFFPTQVSFYSEKLLCNVDVLDVQSVETGEPTQFSKEILLLAEDYSVV